MLNKYNITVLLILIISLIIVEFNTEYKLINNDIYFNIEKNKNIGTLYVGTHNYEHKDIFITMKHFQNILIINFTCYLRINRGIIY